MKIYTDRLPKLNQYATSGYKVLYQYIVTNPSPYVEDDGEVRVECALVDLFADLIHVCMSTDDIDFEAVVEQALGLIQEDKKFDYLGQ